VVRVRSMGCPIPVRRMEPGGTEEASSYESWLRLGGGELIDCKQHHLDTDSRVGTATTSTARGRHGGA
jgi:hypothetical protein